MNKESQIIILLVVLSIIVLLVSLVSLIILHRDRKGSKRGLKTSYKSGLGSPDIFGNWILTSPSGGNESLTILQPNTVLYYINGVQYDNGRYDLQDIIRLINLGVRNVTINSDLTLTVTFQRDNNINSCVDSCNNTFGVCKGNETLDETACQVYAEGIQEITACQNKYRTEYENCLTDQRNCCGSCRGILDTDNSGITNSYYKCNYPTSISAGSVYGYWTSNMNNNELINIHPDNSVTYANYQSQYDSGNYNNGVIRLTNNGYLDVTYDLSSDTLTLTKTFKKI